MTTESIHTLQQFIQHLNIHECSPSLPLDDDRLLVMNGLLIQEGGKSDAGVITHATRAGDTKNPDLCVVNTVDASLLMQNGIMALWDALGALPYYGSTPAIAYVLTNGHGPACDVCTKRVASTQSTKVDARHVATALRHTGGWPSYALFALYYMAYVTAGVNEKLIANPTAHTALVKQRMNEMFEETHRIKEEFIAQLQDESVLNDARKALAASNEQAFAALVSVFAHNRLVPYTQRLIGCLERLVCRAHCLGASAAAAIDISEYFTECTQGQFSLRDKTVDDAARDRFMEYVRFVTQRSQQKASAPFDPVATAQSNLMACARPVFVNKSVLNDLKELPEARARAEERGMPPLQCVTWLTARMVRLADAERITTTATQSTNASTDIGSSENDAVADAPPPLQCDCAENGTRVDITEAVSDALGSLTVHTGDEDDASATGNAPNTATLNMAATGAL